MGGRGPTIIPAELSDHKGPGVESSEDEDESDGQGHGNGGDQGVIPRRIWVGEVGPDPGWRSIQGDEGGDLSRISGEAGRGHIGDEECVLERLKTMSKV